MKWVGLTGGIATGKSTVAEIMRAQGLPVIDADQVVREVMRPGTPVYHAIVQAFGPDVVSADQSLDRRQIGAKVFARPTELARLEAIVHPAVKAEVAKQRERLAQQKERLAIYDVPLLFEKNMRSEFDAVICVSAPESEQRRRLKSRDQLSDQEIDQRLKAQKPLAEKKRLSDFIIENTGDREQLKQQVLMVIEQLKATRGSEK